MWNAGRYTYEAGIRYIQIDLQGTFIINNINLVVEQTPAPAMTSHQIYTAPNINGPWTLVDSIDVVTSQGEFIERCYHAAPLTNVGAVKIITTNSPSWAAWREIGVFSLNTNTNNPTITANGPLIVCPGDSLTLTASAAVSYLWNNGDTTQSITVYTSGNYCVTTGNVISCIANGTDSCTLCGGGTTCITINCNNETTSIPSSNPIPPAISLYPNPTSGTLTFSYHLQNSQLSILNSQFKLIDISGRILYSHSISGREGKEIIDAAALSDGMYFYQLTSASESWQGKVIVEK